jgi:hypothetical protein
MSKRKTNNFDAMGKAELRAACKAAGMSYSKLTVADMRAALVAHHTPTPVAEGGEENGDEGAAVELYQQELEEQQQNPDAVVTEEHAPAPVAAPKAKRAPAAPKVSKAPREPQVVQNGVKQPRSGGLCRSVWDALTALRATGVEPASKDARQLAQDNGWNVNNALIELSRWRKFNGIARQRA